MYKEGRILSSDKGMELRVESKTPDEHHPAFDEKTAETLHCNVST